MVDWQTIAAMLVLAWALTFLLRSVLGRRSGCGGGCGCAGKVPRSPEGHSVWVAADNLTMRRREGE
jgi:hypothetical protein